MNNKEFLRIIELGREGRNLEFKASAAWADADFRAKLIKTILAFSNVRDGGIIVVGVKESEEGNFAFEGVEPAHLDTFSPDNIASQVAEFADPYARVQMERVEREQKVFVVIQTEEFDEMPVVCKKDGRCNLRRGAIYTRSRRMPETVEVPSQTEMREILEMATEKRVRKLLEMQGRLKLPPVSSPGPTDDSRFDAQIAGLR
ncbi:MAG: ATP-binding protein [Verrucomicrobia bacterium]|nr:ATP-binding protein [Verrucomicrobiota bacterium]